MGYSISMTPRNPELAQRALEFGEKYFRDFEGNPFPPSLGGLAYDHDPSHLGFDYGPSEDDRILAWSLTMWLALHAGEERDGRPYINYDGIDEFPIRADQYDEHGLATDEYISRYPWYRRQTLKYEREQLRPVLTRLSELWEKEVAVDA